MFRKIFSKLTRKWQIFLIIAGSCFGLLLFWVPVQCYFDVTNALQKEQEIFSDQFLVLNKKVAILSVLGNEPDGFTSEELEAIQKVEGIEAVGEFSANTFRATAVADFGQSGQVLRTEMFFEAVPDDFLDEEPAGWNWHPKDSDVPIVIPSDYLALYNFGFAPGQQLTQISQDIAKLSAFDILISGNGKEKIFKGRIAGFSDRINTILTPQKFLDHCNAEFGEKAKAQPNRIIVKASQSAPLEKLMQEQGYETNKESMRAGKTQDIARSVFIGAMLIALVVVLISLGSFIQFADLMIARADNEIKTLSYLGYSNKSIAAILFKQIIAFVALSSAVAFVAGILLRHWLLGKIPALIPHPTFAPPTMAVGIFLLLIALYFSITYFNIRRQIISLTRGY
jgi:hypothetical protein